MTLLLKRRLPGFAGFCALLAGLSGVALTPRVEAGAALAPWPDSVQAEYRGCEAAGWCRFELAPPLHGHSSLRVRPAGITAVPGDAGANALRDRLNALLASMIHQHKRIELHDLRELPDGTFAAEVMVNEVPLAQDALLLELANPRTR